MYTFFFLAHSMDSFVGVSARSRGVEQLFSQALAVDVHTLLFLAHSRQCLMSYLLYLTHSA